MSGARASRAGAQRGLSLIELMIAMLIGLVLLLGATQIFGAASSAYRLAKGVARLQEGGRFATDYLSRDIRLAGHMGCASDQIIVRRDGSEDLLAAHTTFGAAAVPALQFNYAIQGYEASGTGPGTSATLLETPQVGGTYTPALPSELQTALSNRVAGSDILVLRYLDGQGVPLSAAVNSAAPALALTATSADWSLLQGGLDNPGLFGITGCDDAVVFQASAVSPAASVTVGATPLNAALGNVNFKFPQGAMLYRAESEVYYVGLNEDSRPSLYRVRFTAAPGAAAVTAQKEELVEGVESMQLLYGQDQVSTTVPTGAVGRLLTADGIQASMSDPQAAWRRVLAVQVGLVMSSPERASSAQAATTHALTVQGVTFSAPDDARVRTGYQSTVTLRNRLYGN